MPEAWQSVTCGDQVFFVDYAALPDGRWQCEVIDWPYRGPIPEATGEDMTRAHSNLQTLVDRICAQHDDRRRETWQDWLESD